MPQAVNSPFLIQQEHLDTELSELPSETFAAGEREADARHLHAQKKALIDVMKARLEFTGARLLLEVTVKG